MFQQKKFKYIWETLNLSKKNIWETYCERTWVRLLQRILVKWCEGPIQKKGN